MKEHSKHSENNTTGLTRDIFQEVTDRIMQSLENGVAPWVKPWNPEGSDIPISATGYHYRGINKVVLGMVQVDQEYSSNVWFTRNMARANGGWIRKGEKGTAVVFFKPIEETTYSENDDEDNEREQRSIISKVSKTTETNDQKRQWLVRHYFVWNRNQIENLPENGYSGGMSSMIPHPESFSHELAEKIIHGSKAEIRYGGNRAFYSPEQDCIHLPELGFFKDPGGFHSTRFHELTHWTGHPNRLARDYGWHPACDAYAKEELVAEMGSAFFCDYCGIRSGLQHPEYIQSWLTVLEQDKSAIVVAATLAQKAFDFVFERAGLDLYDKSNTTTLSLMQNEAA
ncbi:MAG: zincin-like metallopeptidase domain-containing protein [Gammaproteobacteria bacterium]|nr:zincin-like metallopeptidase domain-containing protein [Gammaproteobacteria bacterium]